MSKLITSAYITLENVYDGSDGFTVTLSNPTHTILCDSNGEPMVGELGPNGKAKCVVKVHGSKALTVTSSTPSKGQYAYYIKHDLCENCQVVALTADSFYINTVGINPTGKVVIDVNIEGTKTIRQEMTFIKVISPDINFGIDGKFIYGKTQWCSNINGAELDSGVKVIQSNEGVYGKNMLEVVGEHWIYSRQPVYNNKNIVYKINLRARITKDASNGKKECYIGCKPLDSSGNPCGPDGGESNKNVYLWNGNLTNEWKEYTFYMGKEARNQITDINGSIKFPAVRGLPANAVKFHPLFIVNYPAATDGIVEIDCFTIEDVTSEFETTDLKCKNVKMEADLNGINLSVNTIKTITDKADNPMTLQCKVNYSAFSTENLGEVYVHGLSSNKVPADIDGVCRWLNEDITLPKTMFDPQKQAPSKTVMFMVFDKNARKWFMVWEEKSDTGTSTWKYLEAIFSSSRQVGNFTWSETAHIVVGYFIISDKKQSDGDDIILMAQMFKGALNYKQATTMSLSSSVSQIELIEDNIDMKVDKDGVIAAINIYAQDDGSGNTTSGVKIRGDKIDLQGKVTFNDLSSDDNVGLKNLFNNKNNTTTINGGSIDTNSIKANSIDLLSGLTVMGPDSTPVFAISRVDGTTDKGTVEINGLLRSGNFSDTLNTGYKISPDGTAILNQAKIRGDVELPNAGITNFGARIGNENLAFDSYERSYSKFSNESNRENWCVMHGRVNLPANAQVGDIIYVTYDFEYSDLIPGDGKTPWVCFQGCGNVTQWTGGDWNSDQITNLIQYGQGKNGQVHREYQFTLTSSHLKNSYWEIMFRFDWIKSGSFTMKKLKVETGGRTPWCPAETEQDNFVRFWAGTSYLNRNNAPFRVMQNGDVYAKNGTYEGLLRGTLDSGDVQIYNNAITIHSPGTETEVISFRAQQSIFNTDVAFGNDRAVEFIKSTRSLMFNSSNLVISQGQKGTAKFNVDEGSGYSILSASGQSEGKHRIKYWNGYAGLIFESFGSNKASGNERPYDFKFERLGSEVNVKVAGSIEVNSKILSDKQNIEIRSVADEGWGFYAT